MGNEKDIKDNSNSFKTEEVAGQRHLIGMQFTYQMVAPVSVKPHIISKEINDLVEKYLSEKFKLERIQIPGQPGLPSDKVIFELKDKMEDVR